MTLLSPFPYFGGKRSVAADVWLRLGTPKQYIEPFCGSAAVLLAARRPASLEVVCDASGFIANFWRAVKYQPAEVARWADYPVSHICLGAAHVWLMNQREHIGAALHDIEWPGDAKVAGRWLHGQCCWIGSGWCEWDRANAPKGMGKIPAVGQDAGFGINAIGRASLDAGNAGRGVQAIGKVPHASDAGMGVQAIGKVPHASDAGMGDQAIGKVPHASDAGRGVQAIGQVPHAGNAGRGVQAIGQVPHASDAGRGVQAIGQVPHASDAGRGDELLTSAGRTAWRWLHQLADRLERVRVVHGDWTRCLNNHFGGADTAVFLDPPYRSYEKLYGATTPVADAVEAWARDNADLRIALCGHIGDYDLPGWDAVSWDRGRLTYAGGKTTDQECVWYSPACLPREQVDLFAGVQA